MAFLLNKREFIQIQRTEDYLDWLTSLLGVPSEKICKLIGNKNFLGYMKGQKSNLQVNTFEMLVPRPKGFNQKDYNQAIDLLKNLITYDPDKRYSAFEVLKHPFFIN